LSLYQLKLKEGAAEMYVAVHDKTNAHIRIAKTANLNCNQHTLLNSINLLYKSEIEKEVQD
jgi:hypothetical protein